MVSVKLNTSSSFRAIAKTISTLNLYFNLEPGQPSYGTILVWTKKIGIFSLRPPIQKADDWVLIIDESIAVGHERLLVVYGVRTSQLTFNRALTYSDLTPLFIKASDRWTADLIKNEIEVIIKNFGDVKYIVADGGSAIVKSIRLLSKTHVYDITHEIALLLKKMYGNDPVFIALYFFHKDYFCENSLKKRLFAFIGVKMWNQKNELQQKKDCYFDELKNIKMSELELVKFNSYKTELI